MKAAFYQMENKNWRAEVEHYMFEQPLADKPLEFLDDEEEDGLIASIADQIDARLDLSESMQDCLKLYDMVQYWYFEIKNGR